MPPTPRLPWRLALLALPLALLATACLPEGVRVPQSELSSVLERKVGLIAYLGSDGNIYTIDQGGNKQTPITTDARQDDSGYFFYGMPSWSFDGQRLAFPAYSGQGQAAPDETHIFTAKRDGTELVDAVTSENLMVFWSWAPDGKHVGYIAQTPGENLAFAMVAPEGGDSAVIDVGVPYFWSWAPSGQQLLVHAGGASPNPTARVARLDLGTGVTEQVLDLQPGEFKNPAYAPDGQQVLLAVANADGGGDLVVTDAAGSSPRVITSYPGNVAFAWSPNGNRIAYLLSDSLQPGAPGQLVVADPDGKAKPVSLPAETPVYAFFWSPDSKSLAYFTEAPPAEDATPEPEATAAAADGQTALGLSLDVMNAANGRTHNVATYAPSLRFLQLIPYFEQYHQSLTIWSPDSKNLVVSAYGPDGTPGIFVVAASGRLEPRYIADGLLGLWSWK
jgi:Tol biopolymer transport system component